jgi:hypothetical protein
MTYSFSDFERDSAQEKIDKAKSKALSSQTTNIAKKYGKDVSIFTRSRVNLEKGAELGVIILDRDKEKTLKGYREHPVTPNGSYKDKFYTNCFASDPGIGKENCPLCQAAKTKSTGVEHSRFVLGLTVLLVGREVVDGKLEYVPIPNYVSKGKPVYGKQLWAVFNTETRQDLIGIINEVQAQHKTIRGLYIPVTRSATEIAAGHGALGTIKLKNGMAKTYHFLGANTEAIIEKLAKKIQPEPIKLADGKLLTSELVPVHDYKWASEPLNCYEAMANKLSLEEADRMFNPDFVEKLDESSIEDDFFSDEEEEVSLDLDVAEEEVVAEAPKATTTRTAGGRGRKLNLTKPLVVEKEEDDFGDLEEDAEEEIEEEELQAPVSKKKKVVIEDDGFDEFDLE